MTDNLTIVVTKDGSRRLNSTLRRIAQYSSRVVLFDDSLSNESVFFAMKLCKDLDIEYHGKTQQSSLLARLYGKFDLFIGPFGRRGWTLGSNRNYSLIFGLMRGARKILCIDDDIVVSDSTLIPRVFEALELQSHVGTKISLMADESILGHLYLAGGRRMPEYVSGSFLGIRLDSINNYYLNHYNEDWIWLFMESSGRQIQKLGKVSQLRFNPYLNLEAKWKFQAFGDILLEGVMNSKGGDLKGILTDTLFWNLMIKKHLDYVQGISTLDLPLKIEVVATRVKDLLLEYHESLNAVFFVRVFDRYFANQIKWFQLVNIARSRSLTG